LLVISAIVMLAQIAIVAKQAQGYYLAPASAFVCRHVGRPARYARIRPDKSPWDSNQAIPTLLVDRYRAELARIVPGLALEDVRRFSFLAYPLSGGFQPWCLMPKILVRPLLKLEWLGRGLLGRACAFRLLATYRRTATG
jgi:hypothetical protein